MKLKYTNNRKTKQKMQKMTVTKSQKTIATRLSRSIIQKRLTHKTNLQNINLQYSRKQSQPAINLKPIYELTKTQLYELSKITADTKIMQHIGTGKTWSIADILKFAKDEKKEIKLLHNKRKYYTCCLIYNNHVIGFISGRKNNSLLPVNKSPYDLLLRLFIAKSYSGKGYGKILIKMFIDWYTSLIKKHYTIYSDIEDTNISSIKIHQHNHFIFLNKIKYPNGKYYLRYIKKITIAN
jgi:hypothetical protein